ncbi:MAG TPA: two-component regulator propeller domain-containing protein, partial [Sunxiuqinia sp.]|nr:two-component regulator propeller domain-containing protein [Sunxiuqinia sp.]
NHIFIGSSTNGAFILNTQTDSLTQFERHLNEPNSISSNCVYRILKNSNGKFWLGTSSGLDLFDPVDRSFRHFFSGEDIRDIQLNREGRLWVSFYREANLAVLDSRTGEIMETVDMPEEFREKQKRLFFDSQNMLWIAVLDRGVYTYDCSGKRVLNEIRDSNDQGDQPIPSPLKIFEDRFHDIWITTFNRGIFLYDRSPNPFPLVRNDFWYKNRKCSGTRCLYQDRDGSIWVGAREGAILSRYDLRTNSFENIIVPTAPGVNVEDDLIFSIVDAGPGQLWISTLHSGLYLFDKRTKRFRPMHYRANQPDRIKSNSIYALLNDGEGNLWIGYSDNGLDIYNIQNDSFLHFSAADPGHRISNDKIRCIYKDKEGVIWVGTTKGLNQFDKQTGKFKSYFAVPNDSTSLIDNHINCVYEDSRFILWVGTYLGLNRLDRGTGKVIRYSKAEGYGFNNLFNILEDDQGDLWLNGERGLSKYNVLAHKFENYKEANGLQNPVFYHAACKLKSGELLFGGINGFNCFKATDVKFQTKDLQTKITDIKLFNKSVPIGKGSILKKHILQTDSIKLSYKNSVLTLDYCALNFGNAHNTVYAYRMGGFEKDWNYVNNRRSANYTNLPAGDYTFQVKASDYEGNWKSNSKNLYITILPPPWETWWAYSIYAILVIFSFLKYRSFLIKKQEQKRKEELDEEKLKFFINVSHEFRTPLTLMLNPLVEVQSDKDTSEKTKGRLAVVSRSAQKLLQLVTQLHEFRRLDFAGARLTVRQVDVVQLTQELVRQFSGLAESRQIAVRCDADQEHLMAYLDVDKYEKILNNLLSNALKYSNERGHIRVRISTEEVASNEKEQYLVIEVSDTGIGLSKEQMKNIFDRFYQVDPTKVGAGIGLNYVNSLIKLHHGQLDVKSEEGVGTSFFVRFFLSKEHYSEEELSSVIEDSEFIPSQRFVIDALEYDLMSMGEDTEDLAEEKEPGRKETILIVEDNKALLDQLTGYLGASYRIYTAKNGEEGIAKASKFIPDLIISDIMMPVMDGIEMLKRIKEKEEICHLPIIMLTAKSLVEDRIKGFESGADAYFSKPFYMDYLRVRIKSILKNRALLKERFKSKDLLENLSPKKIENKDELFLEKVTAIVVKNLDKTDFSVKDICTELSIGSSHLFNKLTKLTGQNPSGFIRSIRLKKSVELLLQDDVSVKEVGYQVGFNSHAYFSKSFSDYYGCSPSEHIRKHKGKQQQSDDVEHS